MEDFKIRLIATKEELQSVAIDAMVKENWRPGLHDAECFFECDPTGYFVGELNGKPIGYMAIIKYGDNYGFVGCYVVKQEYRGLGYGVKISNIAFASVKPSRNLGLHSVELVRNVYKKIGFHEQWPVARYGLDIVTTLKNLGEKVPQNEPFKIKSINYVDLEAIFRYDTEVFGFSREAFLSKWLCTQGSHVGVAINSEESAVVGYTVVRPTFVKVEGYLIGPLFADSLLVAKALLQATFSKILEEETATATVCINVPTERNTVAKQLVETIQGQLLETYLYMTRKGEPNACFDKWFGVTTLELG